MNDVLKIMSQQFYVALPWQSADNAADTEGVLSTVENKTENIPESSESSGTMSGNAASVYPSVCQRI